MSDHIIEKQKLINKIVMGEKISIIDTENEYKKIVEALNGGGKVEKSTKFFFFNIQDFFISLEMARFLFV